MDIHQDCILWPADDPSQLQVVDYEQTKQQFDPSAAPEKQAKIALDSVIVSGDIGQLQTILSQIGQHVPQQRIELMMHALRTSSKQGNLGTTQFLLEQIQSCQPQQVFDLMKYALDGAAAQHNPGMMDFLLGAVQKAFQTTFPQQFLELLQHAVNATARQGNLALLKFLMDHTAAATIPLNYDAVFAQAASAGRAETLLKEAIQHGAQCENVILMLLQSAHNLPKSNDSSLGSRQSIKTAAKLQVVKSYKKQDPALFAKLMASVRNYFPGETGEDGDMAM
jgi:hypothetical protein